MFCSQSLKKENFETDMILHKSSQEESEEKNENEVYKTYKGKKYTKAQWDKKEQELWENYQWKKNRKGLF